MLKISSKTPKSKENPYSQGWDLQRLDSSLIDQIGILSRTLLASKNYDIHDCLPTQIVNMNGDNQDRKSTTRGCQFLGMKVEPLAMQKADKLCPPP
ncbi:hypothetical protein Tco_0775099 [Tanacetum coccineum]